METSFDERVRRDVREQYDALFVDEYQDISRIQDAIIQGLHGDQGTLFMVGDVKQSIYRFRGAEVEVMAELRRALEREAELQALSYAREEFQSRL